MAEYAALMGRRRVKATSRPADEAHFRADAVGAWPALVDSTSPRYGEIQYYCAWTTGEVEWMDLDGNMQKQRSATAQAMDYLALLVNQSGQMPGLPEEEATGNLPAWCQAGRKEEVKRRCRTILQSRAESETPIPTPNTSHMHIPPWL